METHSFVSKAKFAFHSAAAKAERVFSDLKSPNQDSENVFYQFDGETRQNDKDSKHEGKHCKWKPPSIGMKQEWHDKFKNIRIGRKGAEDSEKAEFPTMATVFFDENLYLLNMKNDLESKVASSTELVSETRKIPSAAVLRQLAIATNSGQRSNSMKDFLVASRGSSPIRERAALSLSAVKSLVVREKDDKVASDNGDDEKILTLIHSLFDTEGSFLVRNIGSNLESVTNAMSLIKDIHGAPPNSFVVKLSEAIGTFKTLRKMALFWCKVVAELRRLWFDGQYMPGVPPDEIPDLNSCLLYQQLQVINCCISRKSRRSVAAKSFDCVLREASPDHEVSAGPNGEASAGPILYARLTTGELVVRLGADRPTANLIMLETGEPIYSPITQEGPLLTEDLIKETEEFVMRTGSVGAGCSQLLSDMQAFKAANPGCILENFVRWHSPPDWTDSRSDNEAKETVDGGVISSSRGQLSNRMQKEGNLWRELWEAAKPVPAIKQAPLFDEDLAVEGILDALEDIEPSELFEQLFLSLLGLGLVIAEDTLSNDDVLSELFCECKDYIITSFQGDSFSEKINDMCQVYETVEAMLLNPQELKMKKQPEEKEESVSKRRFKRLTLNFGSKDTSLRMPVSKDHDKEENPVHNSFANFFDGKSSLFAKKPPKLNSITSAEKAPSPGENEWTF